MRKLDVFVTGGSGFIGINTIKCFLEAGVSVYNYDCNDVPDEVKIVFSDLKGTYYFRQGDVRDKTLLCDALRDSGCESFLHMAVVTATEEDERNRLSDVFQVNCQGTIHALDVARENRIKKFIYVSSIAAYGDSAFETAVLCEDETALYPRNLYQITKAASEQLARRYKELYNLNLVCVRLGDVYGPWERPTRFREKMSAPCTTLRYALEGKTAVLSRPNRTSWVYSLDVANGLYHLMQTQGLSHQIYNLSSSHCWSIEEWCQALALRFPEFSWRLADEENCANIFYHGNQDNAVMSVKRLEEAGYLTQYDMESSMEDYIKWMVQHDQLFHEVSI